MQTQVELRLSADIGGTFTDMVLEAGEQRWTAKVLTTSQRPELGVLEGIAQVLSLAGAEIGNISSFVHGTTLATNAIIERRGARTALIGTDGFRDILEIGTESRYDQYELALVRPEPLVARPLRFTVRERMSARGEVLLPLHEVDVLDAVGKFEAEGVDSVAVCLLHAYANSAHELVIRDLLAKRIPHVTVSLSHEVSPEIREYERTSTTVANAYLQPVVSSYLQRLEGAIRGLGFTGFFSVMTSGGGLNPIDAAIRFPVRLVESGPAGGAIFAAQIAASLGEPRVLAFDMGGTTAKICLIDDFEPETARNFEVDRAARFLKGSGLPLRIPVIELVEIGAGGGSIASVDQLQRIGVGPESASSAPGPACYGRGGDAPTVTDADLALGLIDPEFFAGGTIRLQPDLSRAALLAYVGEALSMDAETAALGVYEMVCENMASAARTHAVENGASTSQYTVVASGGAAPLHVARVAEKTGASRVIVPPNAGVGSAVGFLAAPVSYEVVRSGHQRLDRFDVSAVNTMLRAASEEIRAWLNKVTGAKFVERRQAFMRYLGQGHEIPVELPDGDLPAGCETLLRERFDAAYKALFKRTVPSADIEVMAWSVRVSTPMQIPPAVCVVAGSRRAEPQSLHRYYDGTARKVADIPFFRRADLRPGDWLTGPAIICEHETSTFVTGAFDAVIGATGAIIMDRKSKGLAA